MTRKIRHVAIEGLIKRFNYSFSFKNDVDFVILIAPNGYGKTVFLKVIHFALKCDIRELLRLSFSHLIIEFDDDTTLDVYRTVNKRFSIPSIRYVFSYPSGFKLEFDTESKTDSPWFMRQARYLHHFRPQRGMTLLDFDPTALTEEEIIAQQQRLFLHVLEDDDHFLYRNFGSRLRNAVSVNKSSFIAAQRTIEIIEIEEKRKSPNKNTKQKEQHGVLRRADDLDSLFRRFSEKLAQTSQRLDRTFPQRVLQSIASNRPKLTTAKIRERLSLIESNRAKLAELNLVGGIDAPIDLPRIDFDSQLRHVLDIYINDAEEKISVIQPFYDKFSMLVDILNSKFEFKSIAAGEDTLLEVRSIEGDSINLTDLSSGEQHELILLYDLIFSNEEGSIYFIDEPEISLHVAWQKRFIQDLNTVFDVNPFQAVIATHSPQIVGGFSELLVDLKEQVG